MLDNISQISNPLLRAIASGFFLGSIVTIPATSALLLTNVKDESAQKYIVYASLVSASIGAIGSFALKSNTIKSEIPQIKTPQIKPEIKTESREWQDWREFRVIRKVTESESITSFYLSPVDSESITSFIPGQFLTIQLNIPDQPKSTIRTYSLSDYSESPDFYRLSIKRELAPPHTIAPAGIASNFMHDHIQEGSIILAKPPAGKFILDLSSSNPVVLISNGVGITPMISMAKALSLHNPERHIWFLHGAKDASFHAFREEVDAIAAANPNLHIIYCYSQPRENEQDIYHHKGYVDVNLIKDIVAPEIMQKLYGASEADYYLCGSPAFMDSLRNGLREWGVPDHKVLFESFTKAKSKQEKAIPVMISRNGEESNSMEIVFSKSDKTLHWSSSDGSILEFAEAHDIYPDYSCREGICGTCMTKITEGEVVYEQEPTAAIDEDSVLICISKPKTSKIILDI